MKKMFYLIEECTAGLEKLIEDSLQKPKAGVRSMMASAQCIVLFGAAFETTATTLTFLLYELAKNPDKQKRAIEEVNQYFKNHDRIEYECVFETPYLDACVCDTLRIYPVLGVVTRELVEDYTLPSGVPLTKGLRVHIPVHHLHHNPQYFPEPDVFRPERFLGAEKERIEPFSYMPFGEGPRTCIGLRFAKMQSIAGLLALMRKCQVELVEETPTKIQFEPRVSTTQPVEEIYLKFTPK
ncbi:unnamed protein product [Pieris brassicae]|uniref:unspecific monooxygenase n=1 Tax=Pieris brassicae TaxID=7116 RepID=A0A9P0TG13_PIEBR|nr:unnamed protein product [Pieris brassicae]